MALLNCLVFCAVLIDSGSEFQILGPRKLNDLIPVLVASATALILYCSTLVSGIL